MDLDLGKSTLLSIMAGFDRPDQGYVTVDGAGKNKPSSKGILISQHGSVFPWLTVQENLMFGLNGHAHGDKEALADPPCKSSGCRFFASSELTAILTDVAALWSDTASYAAPFSLLLPSAAQPRAACASVPAIRPVPTRSEKRC